MAHEIDTTTGKAAMFYAGEVPWHGLGTYVGENPILSEEALEKSGLDFTVGKVPMFARIGDIEVPVPDQFATVRTDTNGILGTVGNRYQIVQNREAFAFMDEVAGPGRLVQYHTAGGLFDGRKTWILAALTDLTIAPVPEDPTKPYLLLSNAHDGTGAVRVLFTTVRVVCNNTLNIALRGQGVTIRHTTNVKTKVREAQRILGLARESFAAYDEQAKRLAQMQMGDKALDAFLNSLFPVPTDAEPTTQDTNRKNLIRDLFESGAGTEIPGVRGTAWAALNAVTDYVDHHSIARRGQETSAESMMFGTKAECKTRALDLLLA